MDRIQAARDREITEAMHQDEKAARDKSFSAVDSSGKRIIEKKPSNNERTKNTTG